MCYISLYLYVLFFNCSHVRFPSAAQTPQERASLLAYKTEVSFPVRTPGGLPCPPLGEAESVSSFASPAAADASKPAPAPGLENTSEAAQVSSETAPPRAEGAPLAAVIADDSLTAKTGASGSGDPAAAGSSSSDSDSESDSDSDSDSEDEKADVIAEATKTLAPDASGRADLQEVTSGVKEESNEAKKDFIAEAEAPLAPAVETRPDTAAAAAADQSAMKASSAEELMDSAPEICTASEAAPQISLTPPQVPDEAATDSSPAAVEEVGPDAAEEVVTGVPITEEAPSEVVVETTTSTGAPGEAVGEPVAAPLPAAAAEQREGVLLDPVAAEAAGEELQEDPPVEPSEGTHYTTQCPKPLSVPAYCLEV